MSSSITSLARDLYKTITESAKRKVKPYDSDATVVKVEDDVAWVKIPGGVDVTPVKKTINAKEGDKVKIRVSDHRGWITGNNTAPPTDDTTAQKADLNAEAAKSMAIDASISAANAEKDAARAKVAAENAEADAAQAHDAAGRAENSALSAQQSAVAAGISASGAEAASQAAQAAALGSITTDTLHYLATDLASNITTDDPPAGHGSWSTTVQTMTPTFKYLWTYHTYVTAGGVPTSTTPVLTGTYGEKGADGTSVTILGSYNTLAELEAAHPTGNLGDAYMVAGDLYVWNGSIWQDVGQIQGPQGNPGADGDDGISVSSVQPQYYLSTSSSQTSGGTWSLSLTYVKGKFIWTRDFITYSNGSQSTSTEIYNEALTQSCYNAAEALGLVDEQQEYFYYDSLGAHVISSPDDTETRYRTDIVGSGLEVFEVPANALERSIAEFGANGSRVGAANSGHTTVQASGMQVFGNDGTITLANIGYGPGNAAPGGQSPTGNAPYYSLGQRTGGIGNYSVAEGINTTASGYSSHAEGSSTTASGSYSHAEGSSSTASGVRAHAEGNSLASGEAAHAEGSGTQATGDFSHAEGHNTWASNEAAHAEGYDSVASGLYSHAQNLGTRATAEAQTVIGKYNEALVPNASAQYAFIIGNGDSNAGSDALRVGWNGNVYPAGKVVSTEQGSMLGTGNLSSSGNNHSYSINAGATKSQSFTISRAGYYPLCIDRINLGGTGSDKICLNKSGITARAYGSVTYEVAYYNPTSTNYDSIIVAVYVLWVKI